MYLSVERNQCSCIGRGLGRRHIMVLVSMKDMISKASIVYQVTDCDIFVTETNCAIFVTGTNCLIFVTETNIVIRYNREQY